MRNRVDARSVSPLLLAFVASTAARAQSPAPQLDHLIVGIDSLERGVELLGRLTGVRPAVGGVHPGRGTRNALLALGGGQYLELMAPDPAQTPTPTSAPLARLHEPTPIGWAARTSNADSVRSALAARGRSDLPLRPGSRRRPDGATLRWRTLEVWGPTASDLLPFFIEWDPTSTHPASDAPRGCTLTSFTIVSPAADSLRAELRAASLDVRVAKGPRDGIAVSLACPAGKVTLGPDR